MSASRVLDRPLPPDAQEIRIEPHEKGAASETAMSGGLAVITDALAQDIVGLMPDC